MMLAEIITKLEAATEGSRKFDLEIQRALSGHAWRWNDYFEETITWDEYGPGSVGNPVCSLERFTTSLDAALMLVPEGLEWEMTNLYGVAGVVVGLNVEIDHRAQREDGNVILALCIAALKARASQ